MGLLQPGGLYGVVAGGGGGSTPSGGVTLVSETIDATVAQPIFSFPDTVALGVSISWDLVNQQPILQVTNAAQVVNYTFEARWNRSNVLGFPDLHTAANRITSGITSDFFTSTNLPVIDVGLIDIGDTLFLTFTFGDSLPDTQVIGNFWIMRTQNIVAGDVNIKLIGFYASVSN